MKMKNVTIEYTYDGIKEIEEKFESFDELKKRLIEIKEQASRIWDIIFSVDVVVENVGRISIALDEKSILAFSNEEISLTSLGDSLAEGTTICFFGDCSEMSNKYIIAYTDALEALEFWINTGEISKNIKWTDEIH